MSQYPWEDALSVCQEMLKARDAQWREALATVFPVFCSMPALGPEESADWIRQHDQSPSEDARQE